MGEPVKERQVDFSDEARTRVRAKGYEGGIRIVDSGEYPGVSFQAWEFEEVDGSIKDGALVTIEAGRRTPVQLVESETTFSEVPLEGKLVFVSLNPEGEVSAYRYDSTRSGDNSFMMETEKGWLMCWYAESDQGNPAEVLEYEEPGFSKSTLTNIDFGTKEFKGINIPDTFWDTIEQLEKGNLNNTPVPVVELSDL